MGRYVSVNIDKTARNMEKGYFYSRHQKNSTYIQNQAQRKVFYESFILMRTYDHPVRVFGVWQNRCRNSAV